MDGLIQIQVVQTSAQRWFLVGLDKQGRVRRAEQDEVGDRTGKYEIEWTMMEERR